MVVFTLSVVDEDREKDELKDSAPPQYAARSYDALVRP